MKVVDKLTARELPLRKHAATAFVVHTTGDVDLGKILRFYDSADGLCPHDVIDYDGTVYRIAPENHVAWHCKIEGSEARLYGLGWDVWKFWYWDEASGQPLHVGASADGFHGYASWRARWPDLKSPLDLATGAAPNFASHGIELRAPVTPGPRIFTDEQYTSLAARVLDVASRNGVAPSRSTVVGHQDCSPMRRCNPRGGWDPGDDFDWTGLLATIAQGGAS